MEAIWPFLIAAFFVVAVVVAIANVGRGKSRKDWHNSDGGGGCGGSSSSDGDGGCGGGCGGGGD